MARRRSTTRAITIRSSSSRRRSRSRFGWRGESKKLSAAMLAGFATLLINSWKEPTGQNSPPTSMNQYLQRVLLYTTGFAPWNPSGSRWQPLYMRFGLLPIATGMLVHYIANATGVNRGLAKLTRGFPVQI